MSIILGTRKPTTIEEIGLLSSQKTKVALNNDPEFIKLISDGPKLVQKLIDSNQVVYGVNTGIGSNCTVFINTREEQMEVSNRIITVHGCGMGAHFDKEQTRAILAARILSLANGHSGIRIEVLTELVKLLQHDILPRIPQEGSVGASGDLAPLTYVAAVLSGQRDVWYKDQVLPALEALKMVGMTPITYGPKEGIAMINGTSVMTGVACLAWLRAQYLCKLATRITSLAVLAMNGNLYHFDEDLFKMKPHPGQTKVAARIRSDLLPSEDKSHKGAAIQDRYSLRCAPHVIGVLEDALNFFKGMIEIELNGSNDNPLFDVQAGKVCHGGHFYGGHIAFAMDSIKCQVANLADLMDRQMALLANPTYNNGLPANLSGMTGPKACINFGLKGLEVVTSGWTGEALKNCMPASVFSRSTENHVQDKVSMGTIAARDCVRVLDLVEQVAAALLIAVRQGIALRQKLSGSSLKLSQDANKFLQELTSDVEFITADVFLEPTLRALTGKIKNRSWNLYD